MANYWKVAVASCRVSVWKDGVGRVLEPVADHPFIADILASRSIMESVVANPPTSNTVMGFNYVLNTAPLLPLPQIDYLVNRVPASSGFNTAVKTGAIAMAPYFASYVECVRKPVRSTPLGLESTWAATINWAGFTGIPNGSIPQVKPGYNYQYYRNYVELVYQAHVTVSSDISFPALPDLQGFEELVDDPLDVAMVTDVTAQAASGSWDLLTELAEFQESVSTVRSTLDKVSVSLLNFARANGELPRLSTERDVDRFLQRTWSRIKKWRYAKALNAWLVWRYGLMPIVYSLRDVSSVLDNFGKVKFKRAAQKRTFSRDAPVIDGFSVDAGYDVVHSIVIKDRYDITSVMDQLSSLISFNAVSTAYELLPWSFVADWAFNIGDYITSLTSVQTWSERKCSYSKKIEHIFTYTSTSGNGATIYLTVRSYRRVIINPFDHCGLTMDVYYDFKRMLDTVALGFRPIVNILRSLK